MVGAERLRVGVEVGGTFTDLVSLDGDRIRIEKVPSTPQAPENGALNALESANVVLSKVDEIAHGSTVATNAVLERKGARTAFVTTRGFRDLLSLQRNDRSQIYDLHYRKPTALVERVDCTEIDERVLSSGQVLESLDEAAVIDVLVPWLRAGGYQALGVCLLNAYANPVHERRLAELLRAQLPDLFVACSSDITREYREYERASTTVISAYIQPVLSHYLNAFQSRLTELGFTGVFGVMQSNGGRARIPAMARNSATALYSGPAAGVIGAVRQAVRSGRTELITFDMGGTSTDVCLVHQGRPTMNVETQIDGLPVRTPVIDIVTVGAGGGSLVQIDDGGMLRVGPQSAGATPGPACYGRGGRAPTVTDAHLVRGSLCEDMTFGSDVTLDSTAARRAFEPIAQRLDMPLEQAADAAVRLATSNIVQAIHLVSTERGHDPRDYVLVPYGGAGPLHAARVAEALDITTVLVPPHAGVLSAFGLVVSDWVHYETLTRKLSLNDDTPALLDAVLDELAGVVRTRLQGSGVTATPEMSAALYMRFEGQAFEIEVQIGVMPVTLSTATLHERFCAAYERIFLHQPSADRPVEIVSARVGAAVVMSSDASLSLELTETDAQQMLSIVEDGLWIENLLRRARRTLPIGEVICGPALITDDTSTLYVPAGWEAAHDSHHNLLLNHSETTS